MKYGKISFSLPVALHFPCFDIFLLLSVMRLIMLICLLNVKPFPVVVHLCSVLVVLSFFISVHSLIVVDVSPQPSSLSAKLSELASRRADWLSSMTIGQQLQQRKSCPSLETVIGGSESDRGGSVEQGSSLHRSASSGCLSSPLSDVSAPSVWRLFLTLLQVACVKLLIC